MRSSMASVRQIFAVISQGNSRSGFHTSCQKLLRKRRGVASSVETRENANDEISNGGFPSEAEVLRAEVNGSSSSLSPDLTGQDSLQNRRFRVPPIDATKGESWTEMSESNAKDDMKGQDVPRYTKAGPDDKRLG